MELTVRSLSISRAPQTVLTNQLESLNKALERSRARYPSQSRIEWLMHRFNERACDPAQIVLLVSGITMVTELEDAMDVVAAGDAHGVEAFGERQIGQLQDLIKLTQTALSKGDRMRVMCMITLDAHTRDMIAKLLRENALAKSDFQWQSQLKQRFVEKEEAGLPVTATEVREDVAHQDLVSYQLTVTVECRRILSLTN